MNRFECKGCGECCRIEGQVRIGSGETQSIAALLGISEHDFIQIYTRLANDRQGLVLTDQPDGSCVFLEDGRCRIHSAKPRQCREFPEIWNNPGWEAYCAGARTITGAATKIAVTHDAAEGGS